MAFPLRRHDTLPALRVVISDGQGYPLDLADVTGVTFSMRLAGASTLKVTNATADVESVNDGIVSYSWQNGDTDTVGTYTGEFEVTTAIGKQTFPGPDEPPLRILIGPDLNNT